MTDNEDQLQRALRAASNERPTRDADWARFEARLAAHAARGPRTPRWRMPLIAAAAVIAVAVATSAVVTGGFGARGQHPAAPGSATAGGTAVPIGDAPEFYCAASGSASGGRGAADTGSAASTTSATRTTAIVPTDGSLSPVTVTLTFTGGEPPDAGLSATFGFPGGLTAGAGGRRSDGTPLGYLSLSGGIPHADSHYLWGAVGPAVAQVQILSPMPASATDIDPGFSGCGAHYTIDSGRGTALSLPDAADLVWTELGGGWHGFAVRLPPGAAAATAVALGTDGQELQQRSFDLATGDASDLPTIQPTGSPPAQHQAPPLESTGAGYSPEPSITGSASSGGPATTTRSSPQAAVGVTAGADAQCAVAGTNGLSVSDSGFGLATVTFWSAESTLCFFDGRTWWQAALAADAALPAVHITGVGPFPSMMAGGATVRGRLVWGMAAVGVLRVTTTAGDASVDPILMPGSESAAGGRYFLFRVPATGAVTVTAAGSGVAVLASVVLGGPGQ